MRTLFARIFGAPLIALVSWIVRRIREQVYADVEGRYYQFKTNPIDIVEGEGSARWLSVSDVQRTIKNLPSYKRLSNLLPDSTMIDADQQIERVESKALAAFLRKAHNPESIRFLRWLERVVILPAEKKASSVTGATIYYHN